jgi:hypothetical protein
MSIGSTNYQVPVQVNGFTCHNCTEVDEAKKHIDPAHPKSGPYGIDAKTDPTQKKSTSPTSAVTFGGSLAGTNASGSAGASSPTASSATSGVLSPTAAAQTTAQATAPGQTVNILA